jgi:hypothetical protein
MEYVFAADPALMFVIFVAFGLVTFAVSVGFLRFLGRNGMPNQAAMPVPNFAASITTAWALALGFAAADIWTVNARAQASASEERSAIARVAGVAATQALNRPDLIASLVAYKSTVETEEWGRFLNTEPAPAVDAAIEAIRVILVDMSISGLPGPLISKITDDFDQLQDARSARLAIGGTPFSQYKWYLVLILTVLSQVALASVHADRPRGGRTALAIFTVAASICLWILALHANPYVGVARIEFEDIRGFTFEGIAGAG